MGNDFLSGRKNGGNQNQFRFSGGNTQSRNSYSGGDSRGNTLEIQDNINDIKDEIKKLQDNVSKLIAQYAIEQNNSGNTNINQLDKQIRQLINGFDKDVQIDILVRAMGRVISNI